MATLDDSTLQAVNNANFKSMAEFALHQQNHSLVLQNQSLQNAITHQKRIDGLMEVAMAQAIKGLIELDPVEASAQVKSFTGNDVAAQMGSLGAAVSAIQQLVKTAQTTPPIFATDGTTVTKIV